MLMVSLSKRLFKKATSMDKYPKSIKKCVQLITISNDCFLLSGQELRDSISGAFILWELSKWSTKDVFIRNDGSIQSELGYKRKQKILYVQKTNSIFINKKGHCHYWNFDFPKKLYLEFINLKSKKELPKIPNFCIFPDTSEAKELLKKYKKAGVKEAEFAVAFGYKIPKNISASDKKTQEIIRLINFDFIWQKRKELKDIVKIYATGKLNYHKLYWLNKQLENVSDSIINPLNFLWKQIEAGEKAERIKDDREAEEIVGMENIKKLLLVNSYRIYGHFAYCCLEFYMDILQSKHIFSCENCGQYNYASDHSDRTKCNEDENKDCWLDQQAKRSKHLRNKKQSVYKAKAKKPK